MTLGRRALTLAVVAIAVCLAAGLAGCTKAPPEDHRIVLGFSQIGEANEWRKANTESIKSAAATSNIDLRFADAHQHQQEQIAAIRQFIAQRVDIIAFSPVVETGWDEVLREAQAAKIPVILADRAVATDSSLYAGFIGSDFAEEGRKAARLVLERYQNAPGGVNIIQLEGTVGAAPAISRKKGFEEIIATEPRFKIIHSRDADFIRPKGKEVMMEILEVEKRPIHAVYAHNDDMALGAIEALENRGLKPGSDIYIVSIDAVRSAFEALIAGTLNATIECNPLLGPQLMTAVTEVMAGHPIPKRMLVEEAVFTAETARQLIQNRKY